MAKDFSRDFSATGKAVNLAERRLATRAFEDMFSEGMALVDEAAAYLDGTGRVESRDLTRPALNAYAQQSMRLSTRLMQLASWLLLRRAVNEGDLSEADARREGAKIDLEGPARDIEQEERLPTSLYALVDRSYALQHRIHQHDRSLAATGAGPREAGNAVAGQIGRLRNAFEGR